MIPAVGGFSQPTVMSMGNVANKMIPVVITRRAHWREVNLKCRTIHAAIRLLMISHGSIAPPFKDKVNKMLPVEKLIPLNIANYKIQTNLNTVTSFFLSEPA